MPGNHVCLEHVLIKFEMFRERAVPARPGLVKMHLAAASTSVL